MYRLNVDKQRDASTRFTSEGGGGGPRVGGYWFESCWILCQMFAGLDPFAIKIECKYWIWIDRHIHKISPRCGGGAGLNWCAYHIWINNCNIYIRFNRPEIDSLL